LASNAGLPLIKREHNFPRTARLYCATMSGVFDKMQCPPTSSHQYVSLIMFIRMMNCCMLMNVAYGLHCTIEDPKLDLSYKGCFVSCQMLWSSLGRCSQIGLETIYVLHNHTIILYIFGYIPGDFYYLFPLTSGNWKPPVSLHFRTSKI